MEFCSHLEDRCSLGPLPDFRTGKPRLRSSERAGLCLPSPSLRCDRTLWGSPPPPPPRLVLPVALRAESRVQQAFLACTKQQHLLVGRNAEPGTSPLREGGGNPRSLLWLQQVPARQDLFSWAGRVLSVEVPRRAGRLSPVVHAFALQTPCWRTWNRPPPTSPNGRCSCQRSPPTPTRLETTPTRRLQCRPLSRRPHPARPSMAPSLTP